MITDFEMLNADGTGPTGQDLIDFSKFFSEMQRSENDNIKECRLCGKNDIKYCNSHTLPQFILNNISENGYVCGAQSFNSTPFFKQDFGVRNTQTFHLICSNCDQETFKDYENKSGYENIPTQKMLKQIAMKDYLFSLYKKQKEVNIYRNMLKLKDRLPKKRYQEIKQDMLKPTKADFIYYRDSIMSLKVKLLENDSCYKILYYQKLDYIIPCALQSNFAIYYGFEGRLLQYPFSNDPKNTSEVHISIFPFEDKSILLVFCKSETTNYDMFFDKLNSLDLEEQLSMLNFIVFANSEDVYLSKKIDSSIFKNDKLIEVSQKMPFCGLSDSKIPNKKNKKDILLKSYKDNFDINRHRELPNILDKEYSIAIV